jgi:hypothetical protein
LHKQTSLFLTESKLHIPLLEQFAKHPFKSKSDLSKSTVCDESSIPKVKLGDNEVVSF